MCMCIYSIASTTVTQYYSSQLHHYHTFSQLLHQVTAGPIVRQVSELKRINHIWNGNELSARSSILIPVAAHSLLLEQQSGTTAAAASSTLQKPQEVDIRKISIKDLGDTADTTVFLERMNADIETLLKATQAKTRHASLNDVKSALTVERIFPKRVSSSRGSGETLTLILVSTLVIFVILPGALVYWDVVKFSA